MFFLTLTDHKQNAKWGENENEMEIMCETVYLIHIISEVQNNFLLDAEPTFEVIISQPELELRAGEEAKLSCSGRGNQAKVERINWSRFNGALPAG